MSAGVSAEDNPDVTNFRSFESGQMSIPESSHLYRVKHNGRVALPEQLEYIFVDRFTKVFIPNVKRDYRRLYSSLLSGAQRRGYPININTDSYKTFSSLWKSVKSLRSDASPIFQAELYCDVFVAAILACPITNEDIFT